MAKRKLKKSFYNNNINYTKALNEEENYINTNINTNDFVNSIYFKNSKSGKIKKKSKDISDEKKYINLEKNKHKTKHINNNNCLNNFKENVFTKLKEKVFNFVIFQMITSIGLGAFIFAINFLNLEIVKNSYIFEKIKNEYSKNYSVVEIKENMLTFAENIYDFFSPIVPLNLNGKVMNAFNNLEKIVSTMGSNNVEIYYENIAIYDENVKNIIEKQESIKIYDEEDIVSVIGTMIEEDLEKSINSNENLSIEEGIHQEIIEESSISNQDEYVEKILNSGIVFKKPTNGVITSTFGPREEIFPGDGNFHHGTDIANNEGTSIYAATDGNVISSGYQDIVGNYIEIENGNIITRYCHLAKRLVNIGDKVNLGDKIGLMGTTGNSTGPHLHFEIMYDRNRIDPQKILEL